jgi:hypothetical protein
MTAPMDLYEEVDSFESFDEATSADEFRLLNFKKPLRAPGGLSTATLNTPKGPAKLTLPSSVATLTQYRTLESAVNALTARLNTTTAQLAQMRRELAAAKATQMGAGGGMSGMLFSLLGQKKLRDDLEEHTHPVDKGKPVLSGDSGGLDSLLPLLLLQPNLFGGQMASSPGSPGQEAMSPLLMLIMLDLL